MRPVRIFFVCAFAFTWGIGGMALLVARWRLDSDPLSPSSPLYYLAAYSVSLAGVVLTARYVGREGLKRVWYRLVPWKSSPRWYLIVLVGYSAITVIALQAAALFRSTAIAMPHWSVIPGVLVAALLKDPGPLGEELGWRGFALPQLLERYSPLDASVRLGVIHTLWHLPLFFIPGMPQAQVFFPLFALGVISIAIFDTVLYLRTGANLLLAILVHLLANVCGGFALDAHALSFFFAAEAMVAVLIVAAGSLSRRSGVSPS
jgi:CAAX protease family protein